MVEVVAAQVRVTARRLDLNHALAEFEDRNVERAAAQVKDENRVLAALVDAVCQRCRRRLVDDAQDVETRDLARVLRRLALAVVEVRRHRDDRLRHRLAEVGFRIRFELLQDHRRNLRRRVVLAVNRNLVVFFAHVTLDRRDRAVGVRYRLTLGELTDETLARLREADDGRRQAAALRVRDDDGLAALHDGDDRVRGT